MTDRSTCNMTTGAPWRRITAFALPVLLSQVFQQLYNTVDALIVGRFLGDEALAAVTSSGALIFLLVSFFEGLTLGAGVAISRYFGANDPARVERAIHTNILVSAISGLLLTGLGVWLTPHILRWMDTDPEVLPDAIDYFRYYFTGVLAVVLYNACKSIMNALGDSRRPLYYLLLSSAVNVVLDLLFIAGFGWGVWSAAVATTISQAISMVLCLIHLSGKRTAFRLQWSKLRVDRELFGEIVRYGLPSGVQNCVISLANVIVQANINTFGKLAVAACGTYSKLEGFAFLPITSFTMALTTYTGQNLGAREYDRAKKGARFGILCAIIIAELIGLALYILMPQLARLFTQTPEVIQMATRQARTIAPFFFLLAYSHAVASVCRGAGKSIVPMVIMLGVWCVLRITYITLIMRVSHELLFLYLAYPITWSISSIIYFLYYHFSDWIHGFERSKI
ncbi:MAG: MATE family efflux transporter [Clostridiales bacterium]|nr:MATE family efflux transporter [Clostridiales bacterium]